MKKVFQKYAIIWAVMFVLFQIIAFVSPVLPGQVKYTSSFWSGYALITLTFVGQLVCAWFALKDSDTKKLFYNVSLITISYSGLILSFVAGGLCMRFSFLPYWVGVIICAAALAFTALSVLKASIAIDLVSRRDDTIKTQMFFIKNLTADVSSLVVKAKSDSVKKMCTKVYEVVRYSDPMSHEALAGVEREIAQKFTQLAAAVAENNEESVEEIAKEIIILLEERNNKCRVLK